MNVPAIAKPAIAAVLGALLGAGMIGGVAGALLGAVLAGGGTLGIQHGLWPWLREIPQRLSEWRTERDSAAFGAAAVAGGFPDPGAAVPAGPPPMPAPPAAPPRRASGPAGPPAGPLPAGGSAAQGDVLSLIGALVAEASSGQLRNVHRVISTLSAVQDAAGGGMIHLGGRLAEPDKDYGPAIWEHVIAAGHQARAGAMRLAIADAGLATLASMTVGEASQSPATHVPHNSQLNGAA